jgi:hypothetical protein
MALNEREHLAQAQKHAARTGTAESDGLFKKTEITRQTQMTPAEEGPTVGEE